MKNEYFIILSILIIVYMIYSVRKNKLSIKTSFGWVITSLIMLVLAIFPKSIDFVAEKLNISYPPTLLLTLCVVILLIQNFNTSKKIYELQEKINYLAQDVSINKSRIKKDK